MGTAAAEDIEAVWLFELERTPIIANRIPVVVAAVAEDGVELLMADGERVFLPWDNGLSQARPYIDENRRGPAPGSPAELFEPGDLIRVQKRADESLHLSQVPAAQAALIAMTPDNGAILSVVGGLGFAKSKFNRVTQAARQPGSNFKPFIYSAALEHGFSAASIINDAPVVFEDAALEDTWRPENDGGKFYGPTRLRWALTKSRNLVSIRLLQELGIRRAINYAGRFGFDTKQLAADLSLALGTQAITPLELATAYASLANGGYRVYPHLVNSVENYNREEIYRATPDTVCRSCEEPAAELPAEESLEELSMDEILSQATQPDLPVAERIMDARVAFIINSILQDVITRGTGRRARQLNRRDIAGKTGTTNGPTDAWFSGYNADVVATAWLGFDQNLLLGKREFGGSAALPIWIEYMQIALADSPVRDRPIPEGIVNVRIDPKTGLLARPGQADAIFEYFRVENVPTDN
jgi:penicillin-binding protein 1A